MRFFLLYFSFVNGLSLLSSRLPNITVSFLNLLYLKKSLTHIDADPDFFLENCSLCGSNIDIFFITNDVILM